MNDELLVLYATAASLGFLHTLFGPDHYLPFIVMGIIGVTAVFGLTTITTMMTVVMLAFFGIRLVPLGKLERFSHALAGAAILLSGLAIELLGL